MTPLASSLLVLIEKGGMSTQCFREQRSDIVSYHPRGEVTDCFGSCRVVLIIKNFLNGQTKGARNLECQR